MNYNFLPFAIGMVLVSTGVSAENFEEVSADKVTTKSLTADSANIGGVIINEGLNNSGLIVGIARKGAEDYQNFIECKDYRIGAYNTMFSVSKSGYIAGTGLCVKESSANHTYSPTLCVEFNDKKNLFSFSTSSYPGTQTERYYPIRFSANEFTFDKGDMIVNGTTTLKDSVAIGGGLEVQKETVLDSTLLVKKNATFNTDVKIEGETDLSTLRIGIPYRQVDKSGKTERLFQKFIECHDFKTPAYNRMFEVTYDGHLGAVSLGLSASPLSNNYCAKFSCKYNEEMSGWLIDTRSYLDRLYPIIFSAKNYTFDKGDMIVNGTTTLKDSVAIGGGLVVQKETVLDSML